MAAPGEGVLHVIEHVEGASCYGSVSNPAVRKSTSSTIALDAFTTHDGESGPVHERYRRLACGAKGRDRSLMELRVDRCRCMTQGRNGPFHA